MPTPNLSLVQPGNDTLIGVWDTPVNANSATIDAALGGLVTINTNGASGIVPLTLAQYQNANLIFTGTPAGSTTYQLPAGVGRFFFAYNSTAQTIWFSSAVSGSAIASLAAGYAATIIIDPVNGARLANTIVASAGGAAGQVQFNSGGGLAGAAGLTYNATNQAVTIGGPLAIGSNLQIAGSVTSPLKVQGGANTQTQPLTFAPSGMVIDCSLSNVFNVMLTGSMTGAPSLANQQDGQTINVRIAQDASGSRVAVWPSNFRWPGGTAPALSTAANAVDLLVATYYGGSIGAWLANLIKGFA